jgi:hypothetical protein
MYTKQIHPEHLVARDIKVFHFFSSSKKEATLRPRVLAESKKRAPQVRL